MCKKCGHDPFVPPEAQMCSACDSEMRFYEQLSEKAEELEKAKAQITEALNLLSDISLVDVSEIIKSLETAVEQIDKKIEDFNNLDSSDYYTGPDEYPEPEPDYDRWYGN